MYRIVRSLSCIFVLSSLSLFAAPTDWMAYYDFFSTSEFTSFDLNTNSNAGSITLPLQPTGFAISNDANTAYVVCADNNKTVVVPVDLNTYKMGESILISNTGGELAAHICMSPDGLKAYVVNPNNNTVTPLTLNGYIVGAPIATGQDSGSFNMAITPDGRKAYVVKRNYKELFPIDLVLNAALPPVALSFTPQDIVISPDGLTAYLIDPNLDVIFPFDLSTNLIGAAIEAGPAPTAIAITPDGLKAYVANSIMKTITPINLITKQAGAPIAVSGPALSLEVSPDGSKLYAPMANLGGSIVVLDIATDTLDFPISTEATPTYIRITPDQAPIASFAASNHGKFDASASSSPVGGIASYAWNFGDGTSEVTSNPVIKHTYAATGDYKVTLQVTNTAGTSTAIVYAGRTLYRNGGPNATASQIVQITDLSNGEIAAGNAGNDGSSAGSTGTGTGSAGSGSGIDGSDSVPGSESTSSGPDTIGRGNAGSGTDTSGTGSGGSGTGSAGSASGTGTSAGSGNSSTAAPLQPSNFTGTIKKSGGLAHTKWIYQLDWFPSRDVRVICYKVFRNGKLIATIPAKGPFTYQDHFRNRQKPHLYELVSVTADGTQSIPLSFQFE